MSVTLRERTLLPLICGIFSCLLSLTAEAQPSPKDIFQIPSEDPKGELYASVIGIFETDPANENPYRIAIRDKTTLKILGSDVSSIDMVTAGAARETTATWSSDGKNIVFEMQCDRRSKTIQAYIIDREGQRIEKANLPDYLQNMLGRLKLVSYEGNLSETATFTADGLLKIKVIGNGPPATAFEGIAIVKLDAANVRPNAQLVWVEVKSPNQ